MWSAARIVWFLSHGLSASEDKFFPHLFTQANTHTFAHFAADPFWGIRYLTAVQDSSRAPAFLRRRSKIFQKPTDRYSGGNRLVFTQTLHCLEFLNVYHSRFVKGAASPLRERREMIRVQLHKCNICFIVLRVFPSLCGVNKEIFFFFFIESYLLMREYFLGN